VQRKYRISTLGCKVNQYESQQVRELLESVGMREARSGEPADLAIVNTCAVTCNATAKSRKALRKLARGGSTPTLAIGCYASADADAVTDIPGVTHALGHDTDVLARIRDILSPASRQSAGTFHPDTDAPPPELSAPVQLGMRLAGSKPVDTTNNYSIPASLPVVNVPADPVPSITAMAGRTRAFLKIQDGCDASCTYCIIPRLRPTLRSKSIEDAVAETRQLVARGYREVVLTGIFMGAYGRETALRRRFAPGASPLAGLVDALARVDGLLRLRLSSLEPGDMTDELIEVLARHECCVPHFHLPLQSGSPDILRRMNRQYTVDDFLCMIDAVRSAMDRPAITTDIIAGFPGETDADFEQTMDVARYAGFCKIHAFPFSPRPGTAAHRWKNQFVHNQTVTDHMHTLADLERDLARDFVSQFVGTTQRVLIERVDPVGDANRHCKGDRAAVSGNRIKRDSTALARGRSDRYFEIVLAGDNVQAGDLVTVRIDRTSPQRVHGSLQARH